MKQKILLMLALWLSLMGSLFAQTATAPTVGDGTEANPYQIATWENLCWFSQIGPVSSNVYFIQTADIDLSTVTPAITTWDGGKGWKAITGWGGTYNGNGHVIKGLYVNRPDENYQGLFGHTSYGTQIINLGLIDVDITGKDYVGGLVGYTSSNINSCYCTGKVTGNNYVGGFMGFLSTSADIRDNYTRCTVTGNSKVGGFVGDYAERHIYYCYSAGAVYGTSEVGGFAGSSTNTLIIESIVFWDIEASGQTSSIGGKGLTTEEMKDYYNYPPAYFDFKDETAKGTNDYWSINPSVNDGYPFLSWEGFENMFPSNIVETESVSDITRSSAMITGNIIDIDNINAVQYGICWGTNEYPNMNNNVISLGLPSATGAFSITLNDLSPGETYYARAYVSTNEGAIYGNVISFYTIPFIGSGTDDDPYQISTLEELQRVGKNTAWACSTFVQTANIDASETVNWNNGEGFVPISPFGGRYYGQGHIITGLYINRPNLAEQGLFGNVSRLISTYPKIEDLGLIDVNITGKNYVGGLVGWNFAGEISRCYTTGIINATKEAGGLVGRSNGYIMNCYSMANVTATSDIGGLVGLNYRNIQHSYSTGFINGTSNTGGLTGYSGTIVASFWDIETSGQTTSTSSIGKPTADMKTQATFTSEGWDFFGESANGNNDYWIMYRGHNNGYPALTSDFIKNAKPAIALISENTGNLSFYVQWDGTGENTAYVDWGNGELMSYTDNTISTSTYVAGNTVKVYGENINYFDASAQGLTALDLSNITSLATLYCNQNKLSSLDVSQNTGLTYISCYGNKLGSLDVSQNTVLTYLSCFDNNISSLNVDQNTALAMLDCSDNDLTTLDVSQNTLLEELYCAGNRLNFATLPQAKTSYSDYSFAPQQNLVATCTNGIVDLSSQLTAIGYIGTTEYKWFLANNTELTNNYMEEDGVFLFVTEPGTVVYCLMTNPAFPNLTLRTTDITIDAKATLPEPSFTFVSANTEGNLSFGADNGMSTYIYIDWGDGVLVRGQVDANFMFYNSTTSYIANNTVKVYARGDVYSLDLKKQQITALDVSKLTELDYLDCSDNSLTTLDVSNSPELWALDCSSNNLGALDLSQNTIIEELDCSTNGISSLNLSSNTILKVLNFSGNKISSINLSANGALTSLNASSNQLNFATLPQPKSSYTIYEYASQANFSATCSNGVVDLSSQLMAVDKDGNTQTTVYTWFLADGTLLTKGTDYVEGNGMFYFTQMPVSTVYCEMNNAAFSALTLRTPNITVDAVVNPNITFVSENNGTLSFKASNSQAGKVYVDWGDGNLTTYYLTTDVVTISTSAYVAGSTVKVYGRDMTEFDARNSGLVAIDVSNASTLTYLNCGSNNLETLDVSTNTALHTLACFENNLTTLDVRSNINLKTFICHTNKLSSLDVSNNLEMTFLNCYKNQLTFKSIPQVKTSYSSYYYAPQANLTATCSGGMVDLSSQLTATDVNGNNQTTVYKWFLADGTELATNYMEENGVFRFFVEPGTELYGEMTNAAFPDLTLRTNNIYIDAKATMPDPNITFVSENAGSLSFIANNSQAGKVYVDWGDGVLTAFDVPVSGNQLSTNTYTANNTVKVYGANISQLYVFSAGLTALDVSKCATLSRLDCFSNNLIALDLTKNTTLTSLSCSENMLTSIDLSYNTDLTYLNCKNNKLTALDVSSNTNLSTIYCFGNELKFNSLPQVKTSYDTYAYAPQANLAATSTNGIIDLSSQLTATDVNGNTQNTVFEWYLTDGTALVEGIDYKCSAGIFFFLKQPASDVYCTMTNAAFPDLALRTVDITVDKTLEVNISFVSEKNGPISLGAKPVETGKVFVDWGDGVLWATDLVQPWTLFNNPDYVAGDVVNMYGANFNTLDIGNNEISFLDVSKATNLTDLVCNNNKLTTLDVSKNTLLWGLQCQNNQLDTLDLSNNSNWEFVYCENNRLNFATLPQLKMGSTCTYSPQAKLAASCINGVVDLSSQLTATDLYGAEKSTVYNWYTKSGTALTAGADYSEADGVFTFNNELADSVFCVMSNLAFPELLLQTVNLKIFLCNNPTVGGEILGNQSICYGDTPAILESTELPTGGTGTIEYQWQASTEGSSAGFINIESASAESYAPGALSTTTWYKRTARVSCMSDWTSAAESNVVEVLVNELPDAPTAPVNQNTYVYDGLPKTATGVVGASDTIYWYDAENGGNSISAPTATNAGTVSAWAETKNKATGCFSSTRTLLTLTINKATLTAKANNQTKVYGEQNPALTISYHGWVNGDGVSDLDQEPVISTSINPFSNAGSYPDSIILSGGSDNNYEFELVAGDFEITKATLTATADNQTKVYGESNPVLTFQYSGFVNGDDVSNLDKEPVISTSINTLSNAGYYPDSIVLSDGLDNNYWFELAAGDFEITKATLTATADNQTKVYGEQNPALTFKYSGFVNGDDVSDLDKEPVISTSINTLSNVGYYPDSIVLSDGLDNNYGFELTAGDFEIIKATLTATADNQTKVYGEQNPVLTISYHGWVNGDDVSDLDQEPVISTSINTFSNAGYYSDSIVLSGGTDNNYRFELAAGDFEITKAILTLKAKSQSKEYGERNPYNSYYCTGWVNGEEEIDVEPVMTTTVDRLTPAGMYSAAIVISGASDNNYEFSYIPGTYRISQAPLTITVNSLTRPYGSDTPAYTFNFTGWKNNDSIISVMPEVTTNVDRYSEVGEYPGALHLTGGCDNNYQLTCIDGNITVVPALLTVIAHDQFVLSGQPIPEFSYSISGFVNGDSTGVLEVLPTASTTATPQSPAGNYPITIGGAKAANYLFDYVEGSLTISDKQLPMVTWDAPAAITYGTPLDNRQLNAVASAGGSFSYSPKPGVVLGAGNGQLLSLTFTPADSNSYQAISKTVTIDVLPAMLTVTANDQQMISGQPIPEFSYSISGFVNGDSTGVLEVLPTTSTTATQQSPAGSYPISIGGARAVNYVFDYIEGILTISDKQLPVLTWGAPEAITYGTPLGNLQLNAVASTPGDFSYSPAAGVVLGAGMDQQLSLTFTPHDTAAFFAVKQSVNIDVLQAVLTVTANDLQMVYGEMLPALTCTVSGFVNGDSSVDLGELPVAVLEHSGKIDAGSYSISTQGGSAENYSFVYQNGSLTVGKATITVTALDASMKRGQQMPVFEMGYLGFKNGDGIADIDHLPEVATSATNDSPAGTYLLTPDGARDNNYSFVYVNGSLTIEPGVGVLQLDRVSVSVFPNPFSDGLTIETTDANAGHFSLCNLAGQVLRQGELCDGKNFLHLEDLRNGVYLVNIVAGNKTQTLRVVKQ